MIVSDEYRYVFIENPLTGSTAIARELELHYGGRRVIRKHALLAEFLAQASPEQRLYFKFSGVRNPLDAVVSSFEKLRTDHKGNYSRGTYQSGRSVSRRLLRQHAWVAKNEATYGAFLRRNYRLPYTNQACYERTAFDFVYRFEDIDGGFATILRSIGLEQVRTLPPANLTAEKRDWRSYYDSSIRRRIPFIFGPFLDEWDYRLPGEWDIQGTPVHARLLYRAECGVKGFVKRRLRGGGRASDPHYLADAVG